ncbi:hypothetical protein [Desulfoferrobacter suflitae]|uniref:hypothetical protein n=1 Tax=Desulfoferrobacter suflitae TaxID=2865782 RepID=UPI002164DBA3|nr:hypothetical protein [Desulfoferrobacter suflitae]MCK8602873.1 hypothetical protein [Desulfoferrobacter suflitae]
MEPMKMTKQMIDFNKSSFDNTFNALSMLQEQYERMINSFLDQAAWLPEEGKKVLNEWLDSYKKGRETFKETVDTSFQKVEDYFSKTA